MGACPGALAATTPAAWANFARHPAPRDTIFDLNVVQTNASYQAAGLRQFAKLGVPIERLEMGNELWDGYQGETWRTVLRILDPELWVVVHRPARRCSI